jgi:hypothetical protein
MLEPASGSSGSVATPAPTPAPSAPFCSGPTALGSLALSRALSQAPAVLCCPGAAPEPSLVLLARSPAVLCCSGIAPEPLLALLNRPEGLLSLLKSAWITISSRSIRARCALCDAAAVAAPDVPLLPTATAPTPLPCWLAPSCWRCAPTATPGCLPATAGPGAGGGEYLGSCCCCCRM